MMPWDERLEEGVLRLNERERTRVRLCMLVIDGVCVGAVSISWHHDDNAHYRTSGALRPIEQTERHDWAIRNYVNNESAALQFCQ